MMTNRSFIARLRRHLRPAGFSLPVCAGVVFLTASAFAAAPVPPNLSGGLDKLVESNLALNAPATSKGKFRAAVAPATYLSRQGLPYTSAQAAGLASDAVTDAQGSIMVRVHFNGQTSFKEARAAITAAAPSLQITAVDEKYQSGVLNAFININDVPALARAKGVGTVALELLPEVERAALAAPMAKPAPSATVGQSFPLLGTTFDAGVIQHRVDTVNRYYNGLTTGPDFEGQGMQLGFISNQFDRVKTVNATAVDATADVNNNDLPGSATNPVNTTPVVLLQEDLVTTVAANITDEGRAMVQIGYRMAPKATLAYATANYGEVGFANNIRALAGIPAYVYPAATQKGFAADAVCDDVSYFDEPLYQDGIIAQGVEDAVAYGVSYFSSAGNNIGTNSYEAVFNYVPNGTGLTSATNAALANTNINLANVPTALYAGGFHNFAPAGRVQDVAQTWGSLATSGTNQPYTTIQWDDPYNQTLSINQPALFTGAGNIDGTTTTMVTFNTPSLTAGQQYAILETADSGSGFDGVVTVKDPNGNTVVNAQDTGTDETISLTPSVTGSYQIIVTAFSTTTGPFHVSVYTQNPSPLVTTDYNILVFDSLGNYLSGSSLVVNNITNNVPYDIGRTFRSTTETTSTVQYVVARSNVPASSVNGTRFRIDVRGNGASGVGPFEYFTVNQANTKGHSTSPNCNGTAAYSVFRPSIPEYYTSPGPAIKYFDKNGIRLSTPDVRLKPVIAAADAANTSFFASDSTSDIDTKPNFGGTSAAAPHACAIAGLVIQAHGGRRSVTPAQMTNLLQRSTFPHDLDPNQATGVARAGSGKITITALSDRGLNLGSGAFNKNSISVSYVGPGSLATLTFNPTGSNLTAGNTTGGNNGIDSSTTTSGVYFSNIYPGLVFEPATVPFAVGDLTPASLTGTTATPSVLAGAPSNGTNQYYTLALTFPANAFIGGNTFYFTIGHAPQHDSTVSNGTGATNGLTATASTQADLFGGTVLLPDGTGTGTGMTFQGTLTDGTTFSGTMNNRIGAGYSVLDGFGFINAQTAVGQSIQ